MTSSISNNNNPTISILAGGGSPSSGNNSSSPVAANVQNFLTSVNNSNLPDNTKQTLQLLLTQIAQGTASSTALDQSLWNQVESILDDAQNDSTNNEEDSTGSGSGGGSGSESSSSEGDDSSGSNTSSVTSSVSDLLASWGNLQGSAVISSTAEGYQASESSMMTSIATLLQGSGIDSTTQQTILSAINPGDTTDQNIQNIQNALTKSDSSYTIDNSGNITDTTTQTQVVSNGFLNTDLTLLNSSASLTTSTIAQLSAPQATSLNNVSGLVQMYNAMSVYSMGGVLAQVLQLVSQALNQENSLRMQQQQEQLQNVLTEYKTQVESIQYSFTANMDNISSEQQTALKDMSDGIIAAVGPAITLVGAFGLNLRSSSSGSADGSNTSLTQAENHQTNLQIAQDLTNIVTNTIKTAVDYTLTTNSINDQSAQNAANQTSQLQNALVEVIKKIDDSQNSLKQALSQLLDALIQLIQGMCQAAEQGFKNQ
jgi:hypothetical protein